jgi:hypothetical protein
MTNRLTTYQPRWATPRLPFPTLIPRTARVLLAIVSIAGGIAKAFIHPLSRRSNLADRERTLAQAFERESERLDVGGLASHQELQRIF